MRRERAFSARPDAIFQQQDDRRRRLLPLAGAPIRRAAVAKKAPPLFMVEWEEECEWEHISLKAAQALLAATLFLLFLRISSLATDARFGNHLFNACPRDSPPLSTAVASGRKIFLESHTSHDQLALSGADLAVPAQEMGKGGMSSPKPTVIKSPTTGRAYRVSYDVSLENFDADVSGSLQPRTVRVDQKGQLCLTTTWQDEQAELPGTPRSVEALNRMVSVQ